MMQRLQHGLRTGHFRCEHNATPERASFSAGDQFAITGVCECGRKRQVSGTNKLPMNRSWNICGFGIHSVGRVEEQRPQSASLMSGGLHDAQNDGSVFRFPPQWFQSAGRRLESVTCRGADCDAKR
jgi:hypothetical protein